jgi:hypothetical protein
MSQDAMMSQQDWIVGIAVATIAGDVIGLVRGVPQCDLKGRVPQDDARKLSHVNTPAAFGERPPSVIPEIVAITHSAGDMTKNHLDYASLFEVVLGCRPATPGVIIKTRHQLSDLAV